MKNKQPIPKIGDLVIRWDDKAYIIMGVEEGRDSMEEKLGSTERDKEIDKNTPEYKIFTSDMKHLNSKNGTYQFVSSYMLQYYRDNIWILKYMDYHGIVLPRKIAKWWKDKKELLDKQNKMN